MPSDNGNTACHGSTLAHMDQWLKSYERGFRRRQVGLLEQVFQGWAKDFKAFR